MIDSETQVYIKLRQVSVSYSGRVLTFHLFMFYLRADQSILEVLLIQISLFVTVNYVILIYEIKNYCSVTTPAVSSYEW